MYEQSVRVPGIVWCPGRVKAGEVIDDLVSLFDFGPTILELAGLTPPSWMEAASLAGYLSGERPAPRTHVFSEHAGDRILSGTECMTMVRSAKYKLVHFMESEHGQLFDMETDPTESTNLWDDLDHAAVKSDLLGAILKWRIRSGLKTQKWSAACARWGVRPAVQQAM